MTVIPALPPLPFSLYILPSTCMGTMHTFLSYPSPFIPVSAIFYTSHHLFSHYTTPFLPIKSFMSVPVLPLCPSHTHHAPILTHPFHTSTYLTHFFPFYSLHAAYIFAMHTYPWYSSIPISLIHHPSTPSKLGLAPPEEDPDLARPSGSVDVGGAARIRKKGAGVRAWLLLGTTGQARVVEAGRHAIMWWTGLPARDFQILDPLLSYPSTVLGRERAIVINPEHIKAIITCQEVLLPNSKDPSVTPFVEELQRQLLRLDHAAKSHEDGATKAHCFRLHTSPWRWASWESEERGLEGGCQEGCW